MRAFDFDLTETGDGEAVLLVPGSFATPSAWKGVQSALTTPVHAFSAALPGYGTTPEIRDPGTPGMDEMVEFVGQLVDAIGKPVHVVGHSWGAFVLLAALHARRIAPLSVLCLEANPLCGRTADGHFPWSGEIIAMVNRLEAAIAAGDPEAAGIIIDFYSRPGMFRAMPEAFRAFCQATVSTNLRDWRAALTFTHAFADFAAFDLPVTLVHGDVTCTPIKDVNRALLEAFPNAQKRTIQGAGHFLISTHPDQCAAALDAHFSRVLA